MRTLSRAILAAVCAATVLATWTSLRAEDQGPAPAPPPSQEADPMTRDDPPPTLSPLTPEEARIIEHKGTEAPFSGEYWDHFADGVYTCRRCGAMLYRSEDKFQAHCGWPAFDDAFPGAVRRQPDYDGLRTEILCDNCGAHLGHVFEGEKLTPKDTRHCVNSLSMRFVPREEVKLGTAIFAGGCFWGVEHLMRQVPGVLDTTVGYTGGTTERPTYEQVCSHTTGHAEAIRILFDPARVSYEALARRFFEIHDPTQVNRQGPDIGDQYRSEVFVLDEEQRAVIEKLIGLLRERGYQVATRITPAVAFWPAEDYHQDYYAHKGTEPYCHAYTKRF